MCIRDSRGAGQNLMPGIRRSDGRRIAGSSVKKPRRKTRLTPQTTLQHSGCSVVSAVKTIWLHLRAGFRQPSPAPSPFRLSGSVSLVLAPCHSAFHSAPPYPFPPHPAPPVHSLLRTFPPPLPVPSLSLIHIWFWAAARGDQIAQRPSMNKKVNDLFACLINVLFINLYFRFE